MIKNNDGTIEVDTTAKAKLTFDQQREITNNFLYRMDFTYLVKFVKDGDEEVFESYPNGDLCYYGSKDDALLDSSGNVEAIAVKDCPPDIQERYKKTILKAILRGEIELEKPNNQSN